MERDSQTGSQLRQLPDPEPFNLLIERTNRGLEVRDASKAIGIPEHVLRYAESGGRPRLPAAKLIADFYGVQVTTIWPVEGKPAAA